MVEIQEKKQNKTKKPTKNEKKKLREREREDLFCMGKICIKSGKFIVR